jgi:hypothetical protein
MHIDGVALTRQPAAGHRTASQNFHLGWVWHFEDTHVFMPLAVRLSMTSVKMST